MPFFDDVFTEVAVILALAASVGAIAVWLRQPLIAGFILVGLLVGPVCLDCIYAHEQINLFAELGVGLLLFVVGLRLNPGIIRTQGRVSLLTATGQMLLTAMLGYLLARALGMTALTAFYVATACTFSSTIIIVKLLSDKREIHALHGRISLGILIVQDIAVVLLMLAVNAWGEETGSRQYAWEMLEIFGKGACLLLLVAVVTRYLLPRVLDALSHRPELLVLFGVAWAIGLASLGMELGFSKEVGAFVAGVSLASTRYRAILTARLVGLRDFLLLFFFINMGAHINLSNLGSELWPALLLSLFVLLGKPLMVLALLGSQGYARHTGAMTGLALGQVSEFSLILVMLGVELGHIDAHTQGLVTLIALITIGLSSYMIIYAHRIYDWLSPWLGIFERKDHHPEQELGDAQPADLGKVEVIIFGLDPYGRNVARELMRRGVTILGIDFDPEAVRLHHEEGMLTLYGDIEDPELFHELPLDTARLVISAIPDRDTSLVLLHALHDHAYRGRIVLTAHSIGYKDYLLHAGADVVLLPFRDAAKEAADKLVGEGNAGLPLG
ncbi:MAG: cation:proton antiporter [Gammaproteobacteria bacterium]|jgi:Kef-type K+ transport system membrane component KefB